MKYKVRRLERADKRADFQSGNVDLDRFFRAYAGQNQFRHHIGTTYVAVDRSGFIAGFATAAASEIASEALPVSKSKRLPRYPVPVLRLARLAVDERAKGQGVGAMLVRAMLVLSLRMAHEFGCVGVLVDAKAGAVPFYKKLGFVPLDSVAGRLEDRPEPLPMFLEISQVAGGAKGP